MSVKNRKYIYLNIQYIYLDRVCLRGFRGRVRYGGHYSPIGAIYAGPGGKQQSRHQQKTVTN